VNDNLSKQQAQALFEEVANYFSLLCEPTRLKILSAVCNGEKSVGEIVIAVDSMQANVSRQINMLYRAKILARRKEATMVYYRIASVDTLLMCETVCGQIARKMGFDSPAT